MPHFARICARETNKVIKDCNESPHFFKLRAYARDVEQMRWKGLFKQLKICWFRRWTRAYARVYDETLKMKSLFDGWSSSSFFENDTKYNKVPRNIVTLNDVPFQNNFGFLLEPSVI